MRAAELLMHSSPVRLRLLTVVWPLCLVACALVRPQFVRPTVSVVGVEMLSGNLLQQHFRVKFNIQNPNDRALPVSGLHATLRVGGDAVASGAIDHPFVVPANGAGDFDMMVSANMAMALLRLAASADRHSDSIDYDLAGAASIDLPFLRDLPFHQRGSFSLPGM